MKRQTQPVPRRTLEGQMASAAAILFTRCFVRSNSARSIRSRLLTLGGCLLVVVQTGSALAQTLGEAVEAPELSWTTGGTGTAAPWFAQTSITHDGVDAAMSGATGHNEESWLETTVTGPGKLVFWWRSSSEPGKDWLRFYIGVTNFTSVSGVSNWARREHNIPAGVQTVRWSFIRDESGGQEANAGALDQVTYIATGATNNAYLTGLSLSAGSLSPEFLLETTSYAAGVANATDSITVTPTKSGTNASIEARVNGGSFSTVVSGSPSAALPLNVGANTVEVRVTAEDGVTTKTYIVAVTRAALNDPIALALDAPGLTWTTSGAQPWFAQTTTTHDGVDAAQSGDINDNEESILQTTVTGPGLLTFWWGVSSAVPGDGLEFRVMSTGSSNSISGSGPFWAQRTVIVPAGTQTLRWRYYKDGSASGGQDAGWVDEVSYTAADDPTNAYLTALSVSAGSFTPAFSATTTNYSMSVAGTVDATTVTPAKLSPGASIQARVNGGSFASVDSGTASAPLSLAPGINTVEVKVTAEDGVTTKTYVITISRLAPLPEIAEALDTTGLDWTSGGALAWFKQTTTTHDGVDAAQSGAITHSQESWVETTVTGPGTLRFWWKVSCENSPSNNWDYLRFSINGAAHTTIDGETGWEEKEVAIDEGVHTLRWLYRKDNTDTEGEDTAWLDQVSFVVSSGPSTNAGLASLTLSHGTLSPVFNSATTSGYAATVSPATTALSVTPTASNVNASIEARVNGGGFSAVASGSASAPLPLNPGANTVEVKVTAEDGVTTKTYAITITRLAPLPEIADALDTTGLDWISSGAQPWFMQTTTTHDGVDAAQSGAITHSQESWVETTVTGPGTLRFWWKVSCEDAPSDNWDYLRFSINGTTHSTIDGETDWQEKEVAIEAGVHTLRWLYRKDNVETAGLDTAWLDQVSFAGITVPSSDASLASLTLSHGALSPAFDPDMTSGYAAAVSFPTAGITVTPTASDAHAGIKLRINGGSYTAADSGTPSVALPLNVGDNTVDVQVTAEDGTTVKTYTVVVTRAAITVADNKKPVVKITAPKSGKTTGAFTLSGTVNENNALDSLTVKLNGVPLALDAPVVFTPNTNLIWTVSNIPPENGSNFIVVEAVDASGNLGTAKKTITFVSAQPELAGSYSAILVAAGAPSNDTAGLISVKVTSTGAFSGKAQLGGISKGFSGVLKNDGTARFKPAWGETLDLFRKTVSLGALAFAVDEPGGLEGTLTGQSGLLANFAGAAAPYSKQNEVPDDFLNQPVTGTLSKGFYTVAVMSKAQTPPIDESSYPQGDGYATLALGKTGGATLSGKLADGTKFVSKSSLRADDTLPLFVSLYSKLGAFSGELTLADLADSDVEGAGLLWLRPAQSKAKHYPAGWPAGIRVDVVGAKYAKPDSLDFGQDAADPANGNASLQFTNGLLAGPVDKAVSIDPATGAVKLLAGDKSFKLTFNTTTGLLSGSFTHSDTKKPAFYGILLNKGVNQGGFGYFLSTPQAPATGESGNVFLDPEGP